MEHNKFEGRVMGYKIDSGWNLNDTSESLDHIESTFALRGRDEAALCVYFVCTCYIFAFAIIIFDQQEIRSYSAIAFPLFNECSSQGHYYY